MAFQVVLKVTLFHHFDVYPSQILFSITQPHISRHSESLFLVVSILLSPPILPMFIFLSSSSTPSSHLFLDFLHTLLRRGFDLIEFFITLLPFVLNLSFFTNRHMCRHHFVLHLPNDFLCVNTCKLSLSDVMFCIHLT